MSRLISSSILILLSISLAATQQAPFVLPAVEAKHESTSSAPRQLTGRFLHITDIHPDPFYVFNSSISQSCHWKHAARSVDPSQRSGGKGGDNERAGYWGSKASDCDAPLSLVNATFDWLSQHLGADQVDFVVWTGDNARHDIDSRTPRSLKEIIELNRLIAAKMSEVYGGVPVVGSVGNNDLYPHNIMFHGPSAVTTGLLSAWKEFIPESQYHTFARGGYYSIEAIPETLLLVSLNTLYFYDANKAVAGCPAVSKRSSTARSGIAEMMEEDDDPGNEQLDWLEQQLMLARNKGMQVWLTGHVPPSKGNWYANCWGRYARLVLSFQDTIVGNLFGHMNVDHFFWLDAASAFSTSASASSSEEDHDGFISRPHNSLQAISTQPRSPRLQLSAEAAFSIDSASTSSASSPSSFIVPPPHLRILGAKIDDSLHESYRSLARSAREAKKRQDRKRKDRKRKGKKGKGKKKDGGEENEDGLVEDDYAMVHVSPSLIPTFQPTIRVWQYNITRAQAGKSEWRQSLQENVADRVEGENREQDAGWIDSIVECWLDLCESSYSTISDSLRWLQSMLHLFTRSTTSRTSLFSSTSLSPPSSFPTSESNPTTNLKNRKKKKKPSSPPAPKIPRHASPDSPSRSKKFLTPLGYTQFFLDLDRANKHDGFGSKEAVDVWKEADEVTDAAAEGHRTIASVVKKEARTMPEWSIEYTTFTTKKLVDDFLATESPRSSLSLSSASASPVLLSVDSIRQGGSDESLERQGSAIPRSLWSAEVLSLLRSSTSRHSSDSRKDGKDADRIAAGLRSIVERERWSPIGLEDLTIRNVLRWAMRLGTEEKKWDEYLGWMYVGTG